MKTPIKARITVKEGAHEFMNKNMIPITMFMIPTPMFPSRSEGFLPTLTSTSIDRAVAENSITLATSAE